MQFNFIGIVHIPFRSRHWMTHAIDASKITRNTRQSWDDVIAKSFNSTINRKYWLGDFADYKFNVIDLDINQYGLRVALEFQNVNLQIDIYNPNTDPNLVCNFYLNCIDHGTMQIHDLEAVY